MLTDRRISLSGPLASRVLSLGQKPKLIIEITLSDKQKDAFCPTYTSLEPIQGEVSIIASSDMSFDDLFITFEGSTKTYVEIATSSPTKDKTKAFHTFLRLVQPMDGDRAFPKPRVIEAGKPYKFPFNFNVPEQLLPQSCKHPKAEDFSETTHLRLPPSLGDPMVAAVGKSLMDDMAPDMGSVAYSIRCRMTGGRGTSGKLRVLAEASKKLRIIPAVPEDPPMTAESGLNNDYKLRKEKTIKKGFLKPKLGRLVIQSAQPTSLRLPPVRSETEASVTTMATVNVRFDPADESCQPPRLNNLQTKLKVATYYASVPMRSLPTSCNDFRFSSIQGVYVETLNLSSRCLGNQQWEKCEASSSGRRDSGWSRPKADIPEPSSTYKGGSFYIANIVVPISLPKSNRVFVPTFHSCLLSRVYAIDLFLSIQPPSTTVTSPVLHLKIPVQISSEGNPHALPAISVEEAIAIASREANAFFNPRSIAPPSPEYRERAQLQFNPSDAPPSPGEGYTHRQDLSHLNDRPNPEYTVRMNGAQQRFQSLSFENEEAALAPPPDYSYSSISNSGPRIASSAASQQPRTSSIASDAR